MKYAILGGAFDPLHSEHIRMIESSRDFLHADYVILVPSRNPPHKNKEMTSFEDRVHMLSVWAEDKPYVIIDTVENELSLTDSYTYLVLPELMKKYPGGEFVYVIGGDSMVRFHTWKEPAKIAALVPLAVVERAGFPGVKEAAEKAKTEYGAEITLLDVDCRDISSTELKARLELRAGTGTFIDSRVLSYIHDHNLYKNFSSLTEKIMTSVTPRLSRHLIGTAIFACRYAGVLNVDYRKAFTAAILHDIAKERAPLCNEYPTPAREVIHQYDGKEIAEREFGVKDLDVLHAILYHTTGRPAMSALEKLVYTADKLEEGRHFDGVEELRRAVREDFETGFRLTLHNARKFVEKKGVQVDNLTAAACQYYTIE